MRVLVLSDIHGNLTALDAVLADAVSAGGFDRCWVLGDTVGYGPQPNECLARIRELDALAVAGNHEMAAVGRIPLSDFNPYAKAAAVWTAGQLTPESVRHIEAMPATVVESDFTLAHGSPRDPYWEYVLSMKQALANLRHFQTMASANGHTHVPMLLDASGPCTLVTPAVGSRIELPEGRFFINPGSVGQPRDRDPRASYCIVDLDSRSIQFERAGYAIAKTQRLMADVGLPGPLAERLSFGT